MTLPVFGLAEELLLVTVTVTGDAGSIRLTVAGEVDPCSAPQLAAALETAIAGGAREVTVDLDAVTFFDSSGVHALAGAYRCATAVGTRLQVVVSCRAALRPLQLSGLWPLLGADPADPEAGHTA